MWFVNNIMINLSNIIDLNSYIRISSIKEQFEDNCIYVSNEDEFDNIKNYQNIIFETSQLKMRWFEKLEFNGLNHTIINCLSSVEIFDDALYNCSGVAIFDNVCCCRNNEILEKIMNYKKTKMLVC